ncbi:MAG TPA: hypothetical protein VI076_15590 [Actinopolymorphaceae bacterium]
MDWERAYERSWQVGARAVLDGRHLTDTPPRDQGRWGVSFLLRPDAVAVERLAALATRAGALIGPRQCWTHGTDSLHVSVRALEPHRATVALDDPRVSAYVRALHETAAKAALVALRLVGLTLSPRGVLACGVPADGAAESLRDLLGAALAARNVDEFESGRTRDMWHSTLVHLTGPVADPRGLVDWVCQRRRVEPGTMHAGDLELVRYRYADKRMRIVTLAMAALGRTAADAVGVE